MKNEETFRTLCLLVMFCTFIALCFNLLSNVMDNQFEMLERYEDIVDTADRIHDEKTRLENSLRMLCGGEDTKACKWFNEEWEQRG